MSAASFLYRFGTYELDLASGELRRAGRRVELQDLPFKLLCLLLESPGDIVSRQELRDSLWPADVILDFENSLNAAARRVRDALGDDAGNPRFIETVPRRGYRFIAPVERIQREPAGGEPPNNGSRGGTPLATGKLTGVRAWLTLRFALPFLLLSLVFVTFLRVVPALRSPTSVVIPGRTMLAVLPFESLGGKPEQAYLSAGLTEELIAQLGSLSPARLGVIGRTSVMSSANKNASIKTIGKNLGVQYVLEGSVQSEESTVRIMTQLIQVKDQTTMWSARFERELQGLLTLQSEIANEVAAQLALELFADSTVEPERQENARAHDLYLRGRFVFNQRSRRGFEQAIDFFERALSQAPHYAPAYQGLSDTYAMLGEFDFLRPSETFPKAKEMSRRALALDPQLADAHLGLAQILFVYDWNWPAAEAAFHKAIELNPSLPRAHQWYGRLLSVLGRHDEALRELRLARQLDPLSLIINADLGWHLFLARRDDDAVEQCLKTLELDADFLVAQDNLKWIYITSGDTEKAYRAFLRLVELEGHDSDTIEGLQRVYADSGMAGLHRDSIQYLLKRAIDGYQSPYDLTIEYAALGEVSEAMHWLGRSFEEHETDLVALGVDPRLDPLRRVPQFREFLQRVGLTPKGSTSSF